MMKARGFALAFAVLLGLASAHAQPLRRYAIRIAFPKGGVSGVCVVRTDEGGGAMSVVNEFGIKAFDAVYSARKGKVELYNVIGLLDRWYVRRTLAADLALVFDPDRHRSRRRTATHGQDGSITLTNKRLKITYHLQPIKDATE